MDENINRILAIKTVEQQTLDVLLEIRDLLKAQRPYEAQAKMQKHYDLRGTGPLPKGKK